MYGRGEELNYDPVHPVSVQDFHLPFESTIEEF